MACGKVRPCPFEFVLGHSSLQCATLRLGHTAIIGFFVGVPAQADQFAKDHPEDVKIGGIVALVVVAIGLVWLALPVLLSVFAAVGSALAAIGGVVMMGKSRLSIMGSRENFNLRLLNLHNVDSDVCTATLHAPRAGIRLVFAAIQQLFLWAAAGVLHLAGFTAQGVAAGASPSSIFSPPPPPMRH